MDNSSFLFNVEIFDLEPPIISPYKTIRMSPEYSGQWLVAGDLDNDDEMEFVSARNQDQRVTAVSAYKLDGTLMWTWGNADEGKSTLSYDVPLQVYDINGDGKDEVILGDECYLIILEGQSGNQLAGYPLPDGLKVADCITFANVSGMGRSSDIIVKTRYTKLWAYTNDWKEIWNWSPDDGNMTCHHPTPIDIDGDGKDEVLAGYTMLDNDGSEMWTFSSSKVDLKRGHLDCCRIAQTGQRAEDFRLIITCCGANLIAMLDGRGNAIWEIDGHHFESADVAPILSEGKQVFVDIDHRPYGASPVWLIDYEGNHIGTYKTRYSRHHRLVDWNGDGLYEIVLANALTICNGKGKRLTSFEFDSKFKEVRTDKKSGDPGPLVSVLDITGSGSGDVVLHTDDSIFIYRNPSRTEKKQIFADSLNFTLY